MAINFPNSPTVGQQWPSPPVAGQPVYTWDGEKWSTQSLQAKQPVYVDGTSPMQAQLTLVGDPVNPTDAADKHYVDTASGIVHYDVAQSLTGAQQQQAQGNIGVSTPAYWTRTVITGGGGTYNRPANCKAINVRLVGGGGGGGGGAGSAGGGGAGTAGGATTFGSMTANGGALASGTNGAVGGTASGGDVNVSGGSGNSGVYAYPGVWATGSQGGTSVFGGASLGGLASIGSNSLALGAGGSGGGGANTANSFSGGGGGAGGYCEKLIVPPVASYAYAVGNGGSGGAGAGGGYAGGNGASGIIIINEYY